MAYSIDWLEFASVRRVVDALGAGNIRFVGGCVRDSIIGRTVNDIDACTPLLPNQAMQKLINADIHVIPTGLKHGTITAVSNSMHIEITTLRKDIETDGRHAEVAFTDKWSEDAKRRDFTMNALYLDPDGTLFDPTNGLEDLENGVVKFIGNAEERIIEDALRIMRFFRFHLRYGAGDPDGLALQACKALMPKMDILSKERIRDEFLKILSHDDPTPVLKLMQECGCMPYILSQNYWVSGPFKNMVDTSMNVRLLSLVRREMPLIKALAKTLRLSNAQRAHLMNVLDSEQLLKIKTGKAELLESLYRFGPKVTHDAMILLGQDAGQLTSMPVPVFPLQGKDLLAAGYQAGPVLGKQLKTLETMWLNSVCTLTKEELLTRD